MPLTSIRLRLAVSTSPANDQCKGENKPNQSNEIRPAMNPSARVIGNTWRGQTPGILDAPEGFTPGRYRRESQPARILSLRWFRLLARLMFLNNGLPYLLVGPMHSMESRHSRSHCACSQLLAEVLDRGFRRKSLGYCYLSEDLYGQTVGQTGTRNMCSVGSGEWGASYGEHGEHEPAEANGTRYD